MSQGTWRRAASIRVVLSATVSAIAWMWGGGVSAEDVQPDPWRGPGTNVIVIVLDDVGTDKLALYDGNAAPPYARTPRLDDLASKGIRFTGFYANPYCSATRACLQTGRYSFRTGVGSILHGLTTLPDPWIFELSDSEVLLPELLANGFPEGQEPYRSGAFGKWHLTYDYVDPGRYFSALGSESHAVDNGFVRFYGTMGNAPPNTPGDDHFRWRKVEHDVGSPPRIEQERRWSGTVVREDAVEWITAQDGPYFAYVGFHPPHTPLQVPPWELVSPSTRAELSVLPGLQGQPGHVVSTTSPLAGLYYRAMLEAVDTEIDILLDQVHQADPLGYERTLVFVVSDNGTPGSVILPPHDWTHGKGTGYQIGVRVPLIVSGPALPSRSRGAECHGLVGAVDLWRTIAEITGADEELAFAAVHERQAPELDSLSFASLILAPGSIGPRAVAFSQAFGPPGLPDPGYQCLSDHVLSITDGEFKYVRRQMRKVGSPCAEPFFEEEEFYHLPTDPEESLNLFHPLHPIAMYLRVQLELLIPARP